MTRSRAVSAAACLFLLAVATTQGQTYSPLGGYTPGQLLQGSPSGSIPLSSFEVFNPANGQLSITIPVGSVSGRGPVTVPLVVPLTSPVWETVAAQYRYNCPSPCSTGYGYIVQTADWNPLPTALGTAGSFVMRGGGDYCLATNIWHQTLTRGTFTAPDGTQTEFIDKQTNGAAQNAGYNRGVSFISDDGSNALFQASASVSDPYNCGNTTSAPSGTMTLRSGIKYTIQNGSVTQIEDTNGNLTVISATGVTDSLGRLYTIASGSDSAGNYDSISYTGWNNSATRTVKVRYDLLQNHLSPGQTIQTYGQLFPQIPGPPTPNGPSNLSLTFNPYIVNEIDLPDGSSYQILYDSYADPAQITLPTGGLIQYSYNSTGSYVGSTPANYIMGRTIATRTVQTGGATVAQMKFPGNGEIDRYDGSGNPVAKETHAIVNGGNLPTSGTNYNSWQYDQSQTDTYYDADYQTVLATKTTAYFHDANCQVNCGTAQTVTTTTGSVVKSSSFAYDNYSNVTSQTDYDWGSVAPGGAALRQTQISYNTSAAYSNANMVSLPMEVKVLDGAGGNLYSDVQLGYDLAGTGTNNGTSISTTQDTSISTTYHDAGYTGDTQRGNLTVTRSCWLGSGASCSTWLPYAYNYYDLAGNVLKASDANGNSTTYGYADNFADGTNRNSFAYPTSVTNAVNQTATIQYDYYTGQPALATDANGVSTKFSYNDGFDRLTTKVSANGVSGVQAQTVYQYSPTSQLVTRDMASLGDAKLAAQQLLDGLGRPVTSVLFENGANSGQKTLTDVTYNALGLVATAGTPWRTGNQPNYPQLGEYLTTYKYDGLGRVKTTTNPDGSSNSVSYSGNQTTYTDEAGHNKVILTDGLGRIKQLIEDQGGTGHLNITTNYTYLPTGKLYTVSQAAYNGTQTRTFGYDVAGRLTASAQPESYTTFQYDSVGNVKLAQDGRGTTKTYTYDAANRLKTITYSDGTPTVTYNYDTATYGKGRLASVTSSSATSAVSAYDALGRVKASSQATNGGGALGFSYTYDLAGDLLTETYPDGRVLTNTYDNAQRPTTLSGLLGGSTTNYVTQAYYWPNGTPWYFTRGNGIWHVNAINSRMQVPEMYEAVNNNINNILFVSCPNWGTNPSNYGGFDICPHASANNNNGTMQSYAEYLGGPGYPAFKIYTQNFNYDGLNRLISAQEPTTPFATSKPFNWTRAYNYDTFGNMWVTAEGGPWIGSTPTTNVYSPLNNRNQNLSYDGAGNQTTTVTGATAAYNAENEMTSISNGTTSMLYDGVGRRVQKTYNGVTSTYVYDAFGLATVYQNGAWLKDYISDGAGDLIASENAAGGACTTCYYGGDHLGSSRLITNQSGGIVLRHDYLPYGEEIYSGVATRDGTFGTAGSVDVTEKFTGQVRDQESGQDYFNARYFTPAFGRFNSPDPGSAGASLMSSQSWNGYVYALGDPCDFVDPLGLDPTPCQFKVNFAAGSFLTPEQLKNAENVFNQVLGSNNSGLSATFAFSGPADYTARVMNSGRSDEGYTPETSWTNSAPGQNGEIHFNRLQEDINSGFTKFSIDVLVGLTGIHEFTHWGLNFQHNHLAPDYWESNIATGGAYFLQDKSFWTLSKEQIWKLQRICRQQRGNGAGGGGGYAPPPALGYGVLDIWQWFLNLPPKVL